MIHAFARNASPYPTEKVESPNTHFIQAHLREQYAPLLILIPVLANMKKSFSSRRAPKRIGGDSDSDTAAPSVTVKRPPLVTKSSKRKSAVSRLSFGPGATDDTENNTESLLAKRAGRLGRLASERNAAGKLPFRTGQDEERPSYSKETLKQLQQSTPSTPKEETLYPENEDGGVGLLQITRTSEQAIIPSEAEIQEKKARRARLAKQQEFISLYGEEDDQDDGPKDIILRDKEEKYGETRLVRDDEDFAEGFDDYVEDGQISLGRKAERAQEKLKRQEMAVLIAQAEGSGSDAETDASEAERNAAYEAAQTRHGTYGRNAIIEQAQSPQIPKITPIPDLAGVINSLKTTLQTAKETRDATYRKLASLKTERAEVGEREIWVQSQLTEIGEKYAHITKDDVPAITG